MCLSNTADQVLFKAYYLDNQGIIHLQHCVGANIGTEDAMIRICVDGEVIYFDKARHSEARAIGVTYNSGTFCI